MHLQGAWILQVLGLRCMHLFPIFLALIVFPAGFPSSTFIFSKLKKTTKLTLIQPWHFSPNYSLTPPALSLLSPFSFPTMSSPPSQHGGVSARFPARPLHLFPISGCTAVSTVVNNKPAYSTPERNTARQSAQDPTTCLPPTRTFSAAWALLGYPTDDLVSIR